MKKRNIFISLALAVGLLSSCGNANKDASTKNKEEVTQTGG